VIEFVRTTQATSSQDDFQAALIGLFFTTGKMETYSDMMRRGRSGELPESQLLDQLFRLIAQSLDDGLGLAGNPGVSAYDAARRRGRAPEDALDGAVVPEMNRQIPTMMYSAMESLFNRLDEVVVPPEVLAATFHVQPEVTPEFIGVDAHSQLARVLFEADYLGKSLINRPELQKKIPRYQSEFVFERNNPPARSSGVTVVTASCRMWITIDRVNAAQSADGNVFVTLDATMRFNIRASGTGTVAAQCSNDYASLLSSLYDDFAVEFPVLHELREGAKLAAAARWLKNRRPGLTLPQAGRTAWNAPAKTPFLLYVVWSPKPPKPGAAAVSMKAEGGVDLRLPGVPGPAPVDRRLTLIGTIEGLVPPSSGVLVALPGATVAPGPVRAASGQAGTATPNRVSADIGDVRGKGVTKEDIVEDPRLLGEQWKFRKSVIDNMGDLIGIAYRRGGKIRLDSHGKLYFECVDPACKPEPGDPFARFGIDCSGATENAARTSAGFVQSVYKDSLHGLVGDADDQKNYFKRNGSFIPPSGNPAPGDFVFFEMTTKVAVPGQATHVGIYLGATKEGEMAVIHASSRLKEVMATREKFGESYLGKHILGYGDVHKLYQAEQSSRRYKNGQ
jgi:hypothetical protein